MIRSAPAITLLTLFAGYGCASTAPRGTPAVHQLAALQAQGLLDSARLVCVTEALVPLAESARQSLPDLRAAEAAVTANAAYDHARSVQAAMRASDVSTGAFQAAARARESAQAARARGDTRWAVLHSNSAIAYQRYAESQLDIAVRAPLDGRLWSDDDAQLLVDYAELRLERVRNPTAPPSERLTGIEQERPDIMNAYAVFMLELYQDPDLPCGPPTS